MENDKSLIIGCSLPDNGGFEKKLDYEKFSSIRLKLENSINVIQLQYDIDVILVRDSENSKKSRVIFHIDLARVIT